MSDLAIRPVAVPAPYVPVHVAAYGAEGRAATPVAATTPLPVTDASRGAPRYSAGVSGFVTAAGATDIAAVGQLFNGRPVSLRRLAVSGIASTAATVDLLLQRSPNGGGYGTGQPTTRHDLTDPAPTGALWTYAANRSANGDGVSASRPVLRAGKLLLGTATTPGTTLEWRFDADRAPVTKTLNDWLVLNLAGQTLPAGASLSIDVEWAEPVVVPVLFAGDSTTANAGALFAELAREGTTARAANMQNLGSSGNRLLDYLLHINGITFPQGFGVLDRLGGFGTGANATAGQAGVLVLCYGINDVRTGATGVPELVSMLDAAINATLNGTVQGATYTSPMGAGTSFTWPANIAPNPDTRIVLWAPNALASDGNTAGAYVTATGLFAGKTIAEAAQMASGILFDAHAAFATDPRVHAVVQKQALFGRAAVPTAQSGLMSDMLHPNARGQQLSARQIMPVLRQAVAEAADLAR